MFAIFEAKISGRLTSEVIIRTNENNGQQFVVFDIASNIPIGKNPDGSKNEIAIYTRVYLNGKAAQNAAKYLVKGQAVLVEGRPSTAAWVDGDGLPHSNLVIRNPRIQYGDKPQSYWGEDSES